ncbi:hypothetical protein [Clostridium sp. YIM B02506]|uniref:hypothetical protein n=1 Tax=Clostridium sp. YIM B02506 TaxID=2910680 RepID=UPI001EEE49B9|nr:hypothetical protein [Clostridium sp. YIM B02506]
MLEVTSKTIIVITTISTFLGFYLKTIMSFFTESLKIKYKNIPEENSIFQVIIKLMFYIIIIIELFFMFLLIYSLLQNKALFSTNLKTPIAKDITESVILILILFITVWTGMFFENLRENYYARLTNKKHKYVTKALKFTHFIVILITLIFLILISWGTYDYFFKSNTIDSTKTMQTILSNISILTLLVLQLKMSEICEILEKESRFILHSDGLPIKCSCYLECKEYYLVINNSNEMYIKKSSIKRIEKIFEEVKTEEMIKEEKTKKFFNKFYNYFVKVKNNRIFMIILVFVAFSFAFPLFLQLWYKPSFSDWYSILASFIGGSIGGITTLIALYTSTEETKKIQNENMKYNNKILNIQILNEKIKDYKTCSIEINSFLNSINEFVISIDNIKNIIGLNGNSSLTQNLFKLYTDYTNTFNKFTLTTKCIDPKSILNEFISISDTNNKILESLTFLTAINPTKDNIGLIDMVSLNLLKLNKKIEELQNIIQEEINTYYSQKYNLATK